MKHAAKTCFQEKDRIIESQSRELELLRRPAQQTAGSWGSGRTTPQRPNKASDHHWHAQHLALLGGRQAGETSVAGSPAAKPPVPSRDKVNRKLHIGGGGHLPPPPPPPRGVSLPQSGGSRPRDGGGGGGGGAALVKTKYGGAKEEADDSGLGWPLNGGRGEESDAALAVRNGRNSGDNMLSGGRKTHSVIVQSVTSRNSEENVSYATRNCDTQNVVAVEDKETDDKFDSGRESDETFDSESVKSESAPGDSKKRRPVDLASEGGTVRVVRPSDKTRVTFWTDTYL